MNATSDINRQSGASSRGDEPASMVGLLDELVENTGGEMVSFRNLLDAIGGRSFGPMLLVPALIAVAPTGAIPGMSILTGTLIILIASQMIAGRDHVWLPARVEAFEFSRDALKKSVARVRPWAIWLERFLKPRWSILVERPASLVVAAICIVMALTMYPLALLPFAVAVPGSAVILFALGLALKDGMMVAFGYAVSVFAIGLAIVGLT